MSEHSDEWYQTRYGWAGGKVKSESRKREFGEVLTPRWVVEKMLDMIPDVNNPDKTVFDPCCGEGAFITCALRRKLEASRTDLERTRSCQTCYGIDIQYDNVLICRERLAEIAESFGVELHSAQFIFARNIIHGDMIFFPMIARFYDWKAGTWTTLEEMESQT